MVGAILQCRMSSHRLPGKVLLEFPWGSGLSLLERIHQQAKTSKFIKKIILATSTDLSDDEIALKANALGIECYRGDLNNVHQRFVNANQVHSFEQIVRLTGDNPLLDVIRLDHFIEEHLRQDNDYSYTQSLPLGCNFEIYKAKTLENFDPASLTLDEREHVTLHFKLQSDRFKCKKISIPCPDLLKERLASVRLTVDYPSDYSFWHLVTTLKDVRTLEDLEEVIRAHPWFIEINKDNHQKVFT